jgi:hypothetical protein
MNNARHTEILMEIRQANKILKAGSLIAVHLTTHWITKTISMFTTKIKTSPNNQEEITTSFTILHLQTLLQIVAK